LVKTSFTATLWMFKNQQFYNQPSLEFLGLYVSRLAGVLVWWLVQGSLLYSRRWITRML